MYERIIQYFLLEKTVLCAYISIVQCLNVSVYNHIKHLKSGINDTAAVFLL